MKDIIYFIYFYLSFKKCKNNTYCVLCLEVTCKSIRKLQRRQSQLCAFVQLCDKHTYGGSNISNSVPQLHRQVVQACRSITPLPSPRSRLHLHLHAGRPLPALARPYIHQAEQIKYLDNTIFNLYAALLLRITLHFLMKIK